VFFGGGLSVAVSSPIFTKHRFPATNLLDCRRRLVPVTGSGRARCLPSAVTEMSHSDETTTVKTSNTAQISHLATYKTTAYRRCVNVLFNDDCRFLVIMPCSLLQIRRRLHGVTFKEGGHHSQVIGGVKKTNGVS
jgi:hypothetical protein